MSAEPEPSKSSNKALIIVGIAAGVIVVVVLVCGGIAYLGIQAFSKVASSAMEMVQDLQSAQSAGEQFLADIAANRLDVAYEATTTTYQKGRSLEEFRKLIDQSPALKEHTSRTIQGVNATPPKITLHVTLNGPERSSTCTLQLIKEGDKWKVDQFTLP
jgi:hypothetical protein